MVVLIAVVGSDWCPVLSRQRSSRNPWHEYPVWSV